MSIAELSKAQIDLKIPYQTNTANKIDNEKASCLIESFM